MSKIVQIELILYSIKHLRHCIKAMRQHMLCSALCSAVLDSPKSIRMRFKLARVNPPVYQADALNTWPPCLFDPPLDREVAVAHPLLKMAAKM